MAKRARQLERLRDAVGRTHRAMLERAAETGYNVVPEAAAALYQITKSRGFSDVEIMIADCKFLEGDVWPFFCVRVNEWYLDFYRNAVHDEPKWTVEFSDNARVGEVEVYGAVNLVWSTDGESGELVDK
jgi:hypothetical protein